MKMCGAVVCAVAMPILALAQGSVSLAPIGGVAASSPSAPSAGSSDVVKVSGKGVGVNKAEALKDAYRDAVERAVGTFVDAEQMVKNDELLKDQVLTQSNAYIEKCELEKELTQWSPYADYMNPAAEFMSGAFMLLWGEDSSDYEHGLTCFKRAGGGNGKREM